MTPPAPNTALTENIGCYVAAHYTDEYGTPQSDYGVVVGYLVEWRFVRNQAPQPAYAVRWESTTSESQAEYPIYSMECPSELRFLNTEPANRKVAAA